MKRYLPLIIIVGVLCVAIVAGVTLWRSSREASTTSEPFTTASPTPAASGGAVPGKVPTTPSISSGTETGQWRGGANAKVTLEEYGDYQCPPCGVLFHQLKAIEKEYGDQMRFVFRHFPLQGHKHARLAAHAAVAAGLQGQFWDMHEMIYQNQLSWSPAEDARPVFVGYARNLKLDVERFIRDLDSPSVAAQVTADYDRGISLGVNGTPALFINGRQMDPNAVTPEGLRMALDFMLGKKK